MADKHSWVWSVSGKRDYWGKYVPRGGDIKKLGLAWRIYKMDTDKNIMKWMPLSKYDAKAFKEASGKKLVRW